MQLQRRHALLILIFCVASAAAPVPNNTKWSIFVPKGWRLLSVARGALVGGSDDDAALVIEQTDRNKIKVNDAMGAPKLNLNPRRLVVVSKTTSGYLEIGRSEHFLPSEGNAESTCLEDPLTDGGVKIERGLLKIDLHYFLSCGGWGVSTQTFSFRSEGKRFRLIGRDGLESTRNGGYDTQYSINYLTGHKLITTGIEVFGDTPKSKPRVKDVSLGMQPKFYLDTMNHANCDHDKNAPSWCTNK